MKIENLEINVSEGKIEIKHPNYKKPAVAEIPKDKTAAIQFAKKIAANLTKLKLTSVPQSNMEEMLIKLCLPEEESSGQELDVFQTLDTTPVTEEATAEHAPSVEKETAQPEKMPEAPALLRPEEEPLPDWTDKLSDEQRKWLNTIAKLNNMLEKEYIVSLTKRANEAVIPTHPINVLYQDALRHDLVRVTKEKKKFAVFAVPTMNADEPIGELKVLVPSSVELELGQCYNIVEAGKSGRCIALSPPVSSKHYEGWDLPTYTKIEKVSDMNNIPKPIECYEPVYLIEALTNAKKNIKGLHECISATVEDVRNPREDLYYLEVNDGTLDKSAVASIGPLFGDNPWKITAKEISESKGKTVLVYGFMIYEPPSKDWYRERLTINPAFIAFA